MNAPDTLARALEETGGRLRDLRGIAWFLVGCTAAMLLFAAVAWWARATHAEPVRVVLLAWVGAVVVTLTGLWKAYQARQQIEPRWVAWTLETTGAWRRGSLMHALEPAVTGTSVVLREHAEARRRDEVRERGVDALRPATLAARRHGARWLGATFAAFFLFLAARPLEGTPSRIWHPLAAWSALTSPVRIAARDSSVRRGESAVLDLAAAGHRRATLFTRAPGEAWRSREVELDATGHAVLTTEPLEGELIARLEAGGRTSTDVRVAIRLPAFLGSFTVTAHYPAYLRLEAEALSVVGDTIVIPEGTRLDVTGRATVPLAHALLLGAGAPTTLVVDGAGFRGSLTPSASGSWRLDVAPMDGEALDGEAPLLALRVLPDSAPAVEIPVPGADTVAGPAMQLSLLVALRDDHGLTGATVEMRRGRSTTITRSPLVLGDGTPDRALLSAGIDLALLGLRPGDTLFYAVVATDNAPERQRGRSRDYWVRVPTEGELRAAQEAANEATGRGIDSLAANAARAQRQTEDLARERSRTDPAGTSANASTEPMSAEAARKAEAAAQAQNQLFKDAERIEAQLEELKRGAERQGMADSAFVRQLDDIRKLMQQADSPELREAMKALQEALKQLDPEATRQAMQDLAQRQAEYKNAMEQAKELFKRAAMESDLANLQDAAKKLGDAQKELTPQLADAAAKMADAANRAPDSAAAQAIAKQEELARRADSLGASLDRAAEKMPSDSVRDGLKRSASESRDAGQQMQQAAKAAKAGKQQDAQREAKGAEQKMSKVEQEVKEQKQELQEAMKEEVLQALDRALVETARLAQRQMALAAEFRRGSSLIAARAEQSILDDAVGRIIAQMTAVAGKNAMVPQQIGIALAAARANIRNAVDMISSVSPDGGGASVEAENAVDGLAVAGFAMLRAKDRVSGAQSGSGMEEAMKEMQEAAAQQAKAAQQSGQQMRSGESSMQQLMDMASQQRAVANQLERMRAGGEMPGAGMMAKEARELTRELESGQLSRETVERQEKLYRKMLDAGRQLQGDQDDDEQKRKATTAKDAASRLPPALDARLRAGDDGIRLPSWDTLQRLSPEERRRVLDYFQRLTEVRRT